jgi:hypothetical protein
LEKAERRKYAEKDIISLRDEFYKEVGKLWKLEL